MFDLLGPLFSSYRNHLVRRFKRSGTLYNFKNVKNTHGIVLLLVKLQAEACNLLKVTLLLGCFSRFLNCTNVTKSRKPSSLQCKSIEWFPYDGNVGLKMAKWHQDGVMDFNPFHVNVLFLYPLKTSENHRFSDIFRGLRIGTLV